MHAKKKLSLAESCTGGLLGHLITNSPGSSNYFMGGTVAYNDRVKIEMLGVPERLLKKFGAVSESVAKSMAKNVRRLFRADLGISITGIAGPGGGTKKKPVGLVYIAIADSKHASCKKCQFFGTRRKIKSSAAHKALDLLRLKLIR